MTISRTSVIASISRIHQTGCTQRCTQRVVISLTDYIRSFLRDVVIWDSWYWDVVNFMSYFLVVEVSLFYWSVLYSVFWNVICICFWNWDKIWISASILSSWRSVKRITIIRVTIIWVTIIWPGTYKTAFVRTYVAHFFIKIKFIYYIIYIKLLV